GTERTHWRAGTCGNTRSIRCAAVSAIFWLLRPIGLAFAAAHAASATGRTHASAFARQRQEPLLSARFTLEPQKTTGQHPTRQVRPHLALHKLRNLAAAFLLASEKGFQMGLDCPIQQRIFRIPWAVLVLVSGSRTYT